MRKKQRDLSSVDIELTIIDKNIKQFHRSIATKERRLAQLELELKDLNRMLSNEKIQRQNLMNVRKEDILFNKLLNNEYDGKGNRIR